MSHSKFLWTFGSVSLAGLLLVCSLNLLVDPLSAYRNVSLPQFEHYRPQMTSRQAKGELIANGGYDTILLGSSRILVGLPVEHPSYGEAEVCNLALSGTTLVETEGVLNLALRRNPLKRVLLGVDFHMFSDARKARITFEQSRFNPDLDLFEYHGRNLLGAQAIEDSWSLVEQWARSSPPPPGARGFAPRVLPQDLSQWELSAKRIRESLTTPGADAGFHFSADRLETFRRLVRRCRDDGIDLKVFITPAHALQLEAIRVARLWPEFEQWKRNLVRILAEENVSESVPLWDFTGFTGWVAESLPPDGDRKTRMKYYLEISHFTPILGGILLERILSPTGEISTAGDFGLKLTNENIEDHLTRQRSDRDAYAAAHADEVALVARLAKTVKRKRVTTAGDF